MLTLKQVFSKSITSKCQNAFGTARVRNFFELDPIFPDQSDPDQHLDFRRVPFSDIYSKQTNQRNSYFEHFLKEAHRKYPDIETRTKKRQSKTDRQAQRNQALSKMAAGILEDPDLGLPYGFGFDNYIQQIKKSNLSSSNDLFLFTLNNLFTKLEATTDIELVQFHKSIIVDKIKHNFVDKAKAIILSRLIIEVQKKRLKKDGNRRFLEKLIGDEKYLKKIEGNWSLTDATVKELMDKIDPQRLSNAAANLARENIDKTIRTHREKRLTDPDMDAVSFIQNRLRKTWLKGRVVNPARGDYTGAEDLSIKFRQYPVDSVGLDAEEFRRYEIRSEIKDVYLTERDNFIEERYGEKKIRYDEGQELDSDTEELDAALEDEFFNDLQEDQTLKELERQVGLTSQSSLTFKQIYTELDQLLKHAPVSIKDAVKNTAHTTYFTPQAAHLSINPDELFWGRIGKYLQPILPATFQENPHVDVPIMKDVLKSSNGKIPMETEKPLEIPEEAVVEDWSFDVSELTQEMKREIEIFKQVKREPYFKHHITNELNYYADRMNDHFAMIFSGIQRTETRPNDYLKFDTPKNDQIEKMVRKKAMTEPVLYNGKAYGGATRKTTKAMAVVKEGTGKIRINRKDFLYYFGDTSDRSLVIEPLMVSGYSIGMDVDLFIWGGGVHSQAEAGSLAMARAIVKFNPATKAAMRENGLLNHDPRQTERKHVGLYKARAKYPYQRR